MPRNARGQFVKTLLPGQGASDAAKAKKRERTRIWKANNRVRVNARKREYYRANPTKFLARSKRYQTAHPESKRKSSRKAWGIKNPTGEAREGICPICLQHRKLVLDHNHETGEHRGWPCSNCNMQIEWYLKNKERLETYVKNS